MSFFTFSSLFPLPLWKVLLDSAFAVTMWLLIVRFIVLIFVSDGTQLPVLKQLLAISTKILNLGRILTPNALNSRAHELYLAFILFVIRYYILPFLADYPLHQPSDLPFEGQVMALYRSLLALF
jgi:hypothetical protein